MGKAIVGVILAIVLIGGGIYGLSAWLVKTECEARNAHSPFTYEFHMPGVCIFTGVK